ncbi:MAG TPA: Ig-like domain-containing protein, partial [Verrucomicrobiae bacterium]|nr:Ig-like domain-containing protein [Verrucomicrobiae bacterium]
IYSVAVLSDCQNVTNSAALTVNPSTAVSMPPGNQTACLGQTAQFSVAATGTDLTYQWYYGSSQLTGQTSNVLTLNGVTAVNAGTYSVVITGTCSSVTNSATLTVNANTLVSTPPGDQIVCPGQTAQFSVAATGTGLTYQWYFGLSQLSGQTNNVLTLNGVTAASAGTYSVVIMGACGSAVTNNATLTVNASTLVSTPPRDQTVCPGQMAQFSVAATGTDLTYQWYYEASQLTGQTNNVLTLNGVTAASAGTYSVVIVGACGSAVTNSAVLTVNQNVSVAPLPNVTNLIGGNAVFTAVASGTGPFAYQWYQGANPLAGQTNSILTLNNLQPANGGSYSVSVTGQCGNAATAAFILTIDLPPVVSITYPTNGQVFIDPATFNVLAIASDPDGTVTNVQFFSSRDGTNFTFLGQTNNTPYLTIASNLPPGSYAFIATATDNLGASAQSAPVTVQVVPTEPPDVTVIGNVTLNLQDGYQWLSNVVCNPVYSHAEAVRIYIHNITNNTIRVVNASGTNNSLPYVESPAAIEPGTCWTNIIMFYDPFGVQFSPTLTVELVQPPNAAGNPTGVVVPMLPAQMLRDGTFLIEFASTNGATYYVQYSSDMVNWNTAYPPITGTGQHMQWIDSGPPATTSLPAANVKRFYHVIQAQ